MRADYTCDHAAITQEMQMLLERIHRQYDFSQFTMRGFVQWVAGERRRPIYLIPWPMSPALFGLWLTSEGLDLVFYHDRAVAIHRLHIQLHELAHMLCGHETLEVSRQNLSAVLAQKQMYDGILMRAQPNDWQEQEAEILSALIREQILIHDRFAQLTHPVAANEEIRVLHEALGFLP